MSALAYSKEGAAEATGLSQATIDRAIKSGRLRAKRTSTSTDGEPVGKYVILASALEAWLESLPDA